MKLFVDDLTHVDFSYLDAERGLVGESWAVRLELDGTLNAEGMICDFGVVKKRVKSWFDGGIDHALAVPLHSACASVTSRKQQTEVEWHYASGERLLCRAPAEAFALLEIDAITPEKVAGWCESRLKALFPDEVQGLKLTLYPEQIDGAFYHYSHGLEKHAGNCQRIAHGHRSRIHILLNGARSAALEAEWAERWRDIYIATRSHLLRTEQANCWFEYQAPQGRFELSLPQRSCYLIDTESTVEQIAQHLSQVIATQYPGQQVEVRAFEGIGKGAVAIQG